MADAPISTTKYLLPVMLVCLTIALGSLVIGAASRRGVGPFWLGFAASAAVVVGRFSLDSVSTTYGGLGLLVAASLWNAIPKRGRNFCPACIPAEFGAKD
jgi:hypothetical protein